MKKRLLSAALALAMVLTLLPVSVFAVEYQPPGTRDPNSNDAKWTDSQGTEHKFYDNSGSSIKTVTVSRATTSEPLNGRVEGKWYWLDDKTDKDNPIYYEVTSGLVAGTSGSGQWYANISDYTNDSTSKVKGAFTVINLTSFDLSGYKDSSLTIDLNGTTTALTVPNVITNLTLTNKFTTSKGEVSAISTNRLPYTGDTDGTKTGLTITATGVQIGAITLKGRGNTVTLNDCSVTGAISMDGTFNSDSKDANKKSYPAQRLTATNSSLGAITMMGDSSTVSLTNVQVGGDVQITGNGGSVTVDGNNSSLTSIHSKAREKTGAYPSATVKGGTLTGGIFRTAMDGNDNDMTVAISGGATKVTGAIGAGDGKNRMKLSVTSATVGEVYLGGGSLTIGGSGTKTGAITIGNAAPVSLSFTNNPTGLDINGITSTNTKLTISGWPANRDNKYGEVDLGDYGGHGINGGTFTGSSYGSPDCLKWFNEDLQYRVRTASGQPWKLYSKTELGRAISDIGSDAAKVNSNITILGQAGNGNHIVLMNGSTDWGHVYFDSDISIVLPTEINSVKVKSWIGPNGKPVAAGATQSILTSYADSNKQVIINATDVAEDVTKLTNVSVSTTVSDNKDIKVSLNGTTITLSGAIKAGSGGLAVIRLDLTTDVLDTSGQPVVFEKVPVEYEVKSKTLKFNDWATVGDEKYGATVEDGKLKLANGTVYTVSGSGLNVSASNLGLYEIPSAGSIVVNFSGSASSLKDSNALINAFVQDGYFKYTGNKAMAEAINAAQATITSETTVDGLVERAQQYVWTNGDSYLDAKGQPNGLGKGSNNLTKHSGSISKPGQFENDATTIKSTYQKAYIVPYLVVNVTDYNQNGALTATLTPYYRVDVSKKDYDPNNYYTVQTGRAMAALTGDMVTTPIEVKFNLGNNFKSEYMHQDGKYVYAGVESVWKLTHAGTNGLGTIVLNSTNGPISLTRTEAAPGNRNPATSKLACTYDTLQAAVDDTLPEKVNKGDPAQNEYDTITVQGSYTGSCAVNMTGLARTIKVNFKGNHDVVTGQGATDVQSSDGFNYTIKLERDTVVSKTNITISSATGGSASVSKNPASVGDKVTITLSASAGYSPSGVSVKTSSGQSVSVSGSGSSYTFTMPSGSVTVTPSFTKIQVVNPTVSVGGASSGIGTASTNTSGQVAPGTTVTVTTSPGVGQRTMGINVTGATAIRTGANTFQFSVPSGYTNVVVTPKFDVNNGTLFEDVWSTEYYSNPVRWAVERGVTNGESTYRFGSGNSCTREQMVTFLYRAAGSPAVGNVNNPFWDVRAGEYYYNAVMWAVSKGITNGVSANQFGVGQPVTRAQAVTFLYRYEGSPAASTNSGFYDVNSREYYAKAVSWANAKGVTNGTTATTFSPNDYCLRAQIVTFLYRDMTGNRA